MSAIEVFTSYSHNDEALRDDFAKHLKVLQREGIIKTWHDREISAGSEWEKQINLNLQRARIILLLVSADFIASDYCWDVEVKQAMDRHRSGGCVVIPIILRPCDWMAMPFGKLQALPTGARPVTDWENRDEAFEDITRSIRKIALTLGARPASDAGLFTRLRTKLSDLKRKTVVLIISIALLSLLFVHGLVAPQIAIGLIENAKFTQATRYLHIARRAAFFNGKVADLLELLKSPLSLQVNLILKRFNRPFPEKPYPFDTTPDNSLVITPDDVFKLLIETVPTRFYLYIYETDLDYGDVSRLLPPENSPRAFTLIENTSTVKIPAGENRWRQLKQHRQMTTSIKAIHVLASRWRAKDIEAYYREAHVLLEGDDLSLSERKSLINELLAKISLRADTNSSCFYYEQLSFRHDK